MTVGVWEVEVYSLPGLGRSSSRTGRWHISAYHERLHPVGLKQAMTWAREGVDSTPSHEERRTFYRLRNTETQQTIMVG